MSRNRLNLLTLVTLLIHFFIAVPSQAEGQRAKRPFAVTDLPEAGLQIFVPARPQWNWETQRRHDTYAIILSTPEDYYPPTSIDIVSVPDITIKKELLPIIALKSLATVRKSASAMSPEVIKKMERVTYGDILGYE